MSLTSEKRKHVDEEQNDDDGTSKNSQKVVVTQSDQHNHDKGNMNYNHQHKKKKHNQNKKKNNHKKKNHKRQFWVDSCTPNQPNKKIDKDSIVKVFINAVELSDDHKYGNIHNHLANDNNEIVADKSIQLEDTKIDKVEQKVEQEEEVNQHGDALNQNWHQRIQDDDESRKSKNEMKQIEKQVDYNFIKIRTGNPFIHIMRSKLANHYRKHRYSRDAFEELPNGDCGDGVINPYPKNEVDDKYWAQRKRFFSKFDDGIELDKEGWYSVTPEAIATHVAKRMVEEIKGLEKNEEKPCIILDAFCGCGGNAIAFANQCASDVELVICVDIDRSKLKMAANNASIYGIDKDRILFIEADSTFILDQCYKDGSLLLTKRSNSDKQKIKLEYFKGYKIGGCDHLPQRLDAIFLSPPWAGPDYITRSTNGYTLQTISMKQWNGRSIDGEDLLIMSKHACKLNLVIYFLPRNINGWEVGKSAWKAGYNNMEVEKNVLNGKLKTVTIYLKN